MTLHVGRPVSSLCTREPVVASPGTPLREIAHLLWRESVGVVVVGDAAHPVGVCSERDVTIAIARGADPDTTTAREVMTDFVIAVRPEDPLFDTAGQMLDDGIRHLPVIDELGTVRGMVSVRDLLRPLLLDALTPEPATVG